MQEEKWNAKISRYLDGSANEAERAEVDDWYDRMDDHPGLTGILSARAMESGMQCGFEAVLEAIRPAGPAVAVNGSEKKSVKIA